MQLHNIEMCDRDTLIEQFSQSQVTHASIQLSQSRVTHASIQFNQSQVNQYAVQIESSHPVESSGLVKSTSAGHCKAVIE